MPVSEHEFLLQDHFLAVLATNDSELLCEFFKEHPLSVNVMCPEDDSYGDFSGVTPFFGALLKRDLVLVQCLNELSGDFDFFAEKYNISAGQLYINAFPVCSLMLRQ